MTETVETLTRKINRLEKEKALLVKALRIAGKYARQNPPGAFPEEEENFSDFVNALCGGADDPEGKKFTTWWLMQAKEKISNED